MTWIDATLGALTAVVTLMTLLPFVKAPHGLVRGPDFARIQLLFTGLLLILIVVWRASPAWQLPLIAALGVNVLINGAVFVKFSPVWPKQSAAPSPDLLANTDRHLRVLTSNVKMSNRAYDRLIDLVRSEEPDLFAAIEIDAQWADALQAVAPDFQHHIELPLDTGYGLLLYSRLPLSDVTCRQIVTEGVPSIWADVTLRSGDFIHIGILHPEPPVAQEWTTGRDSELAKAGLMAIDAKYPALIAGDLNDVAWSHTTRRFQRITGLLDPRVGRGFFNTFNALTPFLRWPLDHLFHDNRFRLVDMRRLPKIGSDHFPMSFTLALADDPAGAPPAPKRGEKAKVKDMIKTEEACDRTPIGTDWERDSE